LRHAWTLTKVRMRLALRNRAFIFFSLVFPLVFLFLFLGLFTRGNVSAVPYMLASVLALTIMGSFWGLSMQLVTFREQGILRRFRVAPVSAGAMLASSIASNYLLTLPTVFIEFAVARRLFHMRDWGNLWGVFILVTLGIVTFASLGLIVASVTNTAQETQVINQLLWSAFLFLSGATLPLPLLPTWIQHFALFMPATYLVVGLERVLIARVGAFAIRAELLSLAVSACIAFVVSQQLFRWEPEAKVPRTAKLWAASAIVPFLLLGIWETSYGHVRSTANLDFMSTVQQDAPRGRGRLRIIPQNEGPQNDAPQNDAPGETAPQNSAPAPK
jgi:ABC-2 type transport system permease protein